MNEKIDLTKLLKDCPKGMPLDCAIFDNTTFYNIESNKDNEYPIRIETANGHFMDFTKYGTYTDAPEAKCLIFPKGKTTWKGFHRPFKNGDILYIDCNEDDEDYEEYQYIFILKEINGDEIHCYCYVDKAGENERFETCWLTTTNYTPRFASLIEKEKLFDAIKSRGYKWNDTTNTLEKLIEPKFKVGDIITTKNGLQTYKITGVTSEYYSSKIQGNDCVEVLPVKNQDDWILIPNKFDYKTLQPFDKVLVRQYDVSTWCADFYSYYDEFGGYAECTGGVHYNFCIPYNEDTKHLVGKSEDAPDFYRYWED